MSLAKLKKIFLSSTLWLNRLSLLLGVFISIGYAYISFPSLFGLVFGIITSLSNLYIMWIFSDNALNKSINETKKKSFKSLYLVLAVLSALLSCTSVFLHTQSSIFMLSPFLPSILSLSLISVTSYVFASFFTLSILLFTVIQLYRRWQLLNGVKSSDIKVNNLFQSITLYFSNFTNLMNLFVTIGHVLANGSSILNFISGIFLSLCDLFVLCVFNYQLLSLPTENQKPSIKKQSASAYYTKARIFFVGSIIGILGSKIGTFIVHFTGTLILGGALGAPLPLSLSVAIVVASVVTVSGLLFSSVQAHNLWEKIGSNNNASVNEEKTNKIENNSLTPSDYLFKKEAKSPCEIEQTTPLNVKGLTLFETPNKEAEKEKISATNSGDEGPHPTLFMA